MQDAPRIAGAVIMIVWTVARGYFSMRSRPRHVTIEDMPLRRRLLLGLVSASLVPVYLYYFTGLLSPADVPLPLAVRWIGVGLLAASLALFIWSHVALGRSWTVAVSVVDDQELVTTGPFARIRHPMYAALILMAIGLVPATANAVASVPYLATILIVYFERVADEEGLMIRFYGDEYRSYMARTGRLLPRRGARRRTC